MIKNVILTIMCMVKNDKGEILVENRIKKDWPGLTFPGGHVENKETCLEACIREVKEETGLDISDIELKGHIDWNNPDEDVRHLCILYVANKYKGNIKSSKEGEVFFVGWEDLNKYPFSNDFDKILELMKKE